MSKNSTRSVNIWILRSVFCCAAIFSSPASLASEIKVTLFEQPCLFSGPGDQAVLTAIHSISPEKVPPEQTLEQAKITLNVVRGIKKPLPPAVEQYRDHLKKRLMALIAFHDSINAARKKSNINLFLANVREHVFESKLRSFEASARGLAEKASLPWSTAFIDQLKILYETGIQPHPEEEFHKAIQVSQIRYTCAFDETPDGEEGIEDEMEAAEEAPLPEESQQVSQPAGVVKVGAAARAIPVTNPSAKAPAPAESKN